MRLILIKSAQYIRASSSYCPVGSMSPSNFPRRSLRLSAVLAVSIALALNAPLYAAAQSSVASGSTQRIAFDVPA